MCDGLRCWRSLPLHSEQGCCRPDVRFTSSRPCCLWKWRFCMDSLLSILNNNRVLGENAGPSTFVLSVLFCVLLINFILCLLFIIKKIHLTIYVLTEAKLIFLEKTAVMHANRITIKGFCSSSLKPKTLSFKTARSC